MGETEAVVENPRRFVSGRGLAHALTEPPVLIVLWGAAVLHALLIFGQVRNGFTRWDFSHYYVSALAMREGLSPYTTDLRPYLAAQTGIEGIERATYPPTFLLCFEPLTLMTPWAAYWTWFGINVAALALALTLLFGESPGLKVRQTMALIPLAILYPPLGTHFFYAQSQILILLLLTLTMWAARRGYDRAAGLVLASAGLLKIFPLLMVGYFATRRRWCAIAYTVAGAIAGAIVTMGLLGLQRSFVFINAAHLVASKEFIERPANIALGPFVSRLFWYASGQIGRSEGLMLGWQRRVVALVAELLLLGLTVRATWTTKVVDDADRRAFSLWMVAMILLAPTAWIHYAVLLLIPFVIVAAAGWAKRAPARTVWLAVASYALLALAMAIEPSLEKHAPLFAIVVDECGFVSVLLAYCSAYSFAAGPEVGTQ